MGTDLSLENISRLFASDVDQQDILYFKVLLSAILNVDKKYVSYTRPEGIDKKKTKRFLQVERSFTYELYHQWSLLLQNENNNPKNLIINSEISKYLMSNEHCTAKQPDFVLHEGQESDTNNTIVGEVKNYEYYHYSNRKEAVDDIIKLLCFLNGQMYTQKISTGPGISYKYAFFLVYNNEIKESPVFIDTIFIENTKKKNIKAEGYPKTR